MPPGLQRATAISPSGCVTAAPTTGSVSVRSPGFRRVVRRPYIAPQINEAQLEQKRSTSMKTTLMVCTVAAGLLVVAAGNAAVNEGKATQLAAKYNCQACHALDKKVVGPA